MNTHLIEDELFKTGSSDQIVDYVYEQLRLLLGKHKLPSFNKYLETLRFKIWDKYKNRNIDELDYLIMDGLYYDEYIHFKKIIKVFRDTKDLVFLDEKLKQLGEQLFSCRQHKSLSITHYSFHAYVNILLTQHVKEIDKRVLNELHSVSLHLNHAFSGVGSWVA